MEPNLDDILNSNDPIEPTPAEATPAPVETPAEAPAVARDERGRFAKKDETGVEPTAAEEAPVEQQVPPTAQPSDQLPREEYTALKAVRDENKGLKDELRQIREQFARMQQQPAPQQAPQQPPVDFWEDPHGYMSQQFNQFGQSLIQQFEARQNELRIDASEQAAKAKYPDYSEAFSAFENAVRANPRLAAEMAQAADPAEFAYSRGKTALALQNVGSLDDLKAQIRAELEAEARAAIQPRPTPQLPSTTAADGSVGARSGPAWTGPMPLEQILGK